ncbi:F-box/LRR-repeat protein 2-like [Sycon ciliatum]|uniref:F-box/LRR-repeat protein 2-like n=1 Tax=Sycon ciliatum TaxID=27933 RepID=UPI0031F68D01
MAASSNSRNGGLPSPTAPSKPKLEAQLSSGSTSTDGDLSVCLINYILSPDALLQIFFNLDIISLCRCAQVCKSWNRLALDGSVWKNVNLFEFQIAITGKVFRNIVTRCRGFLRKLNLYGCQALQDADLVPFIGHCSRLKELNLQGCCTLTSASISEMTKHCHDLVRLNVSNGPVVDDAACTAIASGCKRLEHLDLAWCARMSESGVITLVKELTRITSLILRGCTGAVNDASMKAIGEHCPQLTVLDVSHIPHTLFDPGIGHIAAGCKHLRHINLSISTQLTEQSQMFLAEHCHELRTVEVSLCIHMTARGFQALFAGCPGLQRLDMEECYEITDATIRKLGQNCHGLRWLSISHCVHVTNYGIECLAHTPCRKTLQVLELDNLPLITDSVTEFLMRFPRLQRVDLYDCGGITRNAVDALQERAPGLAVQTYFAPSLPSLEMQELAEDGQGRRRRRRRCGCSKACCVIQ